MSGALVRLMAVAVMSSLTILASPGVGAAAERSDCAVSVERATAFREQFGFSTDPDLIRQLNRDPTADCSFGVPLSGDEMAEIDRRSSVAQAAVPANDYVHNHADQFGGLYIDQRAGGQIVVLTIPQTPFSALSAATALLDDIDYRVEQVKYSYDRLLAVMNEVMHDFPFATTGVNSAGVDTIRNRVEISINPDMFRKTRSAIAEQYPADLVVFVSAGPGHDVGGRPPPTDAGPGNTDRSGRDGLLAGAFLLSALWALRRLPRPRAHRGDELGAPFES